MRIVGRRKRKTKPSILSLAAPAALVLAVTAAATGCGASSGTDANTVRIGVVVSTTGRSAPFGKQQTDGLKLAETKINDSGLLGGGRKLDFAFTDDHSQVNQAAALYDRLINSDQVSAIIGPTSSTSAQTTSPVAQSQGVPVLLVSASAVKGITDVGDHIWRDSLTDNQLIPQTVSAAKDEYHIRRGVLLYANDDATTRSAADTFETQLSKTGIELSKKLSFASTDKDFATQLTQARAEHPDALFVAAVPQGGVGLLQQARQLGLTLPVIGSNGFNSPDFIGGAGAAADNVVVASAWDIHAANPLSTSFVADYRKAYGHDPDQFSAQAYAGAFILAEAIKKGGTDRAGIEKGLLAVKNLPTVLGTFNFTAGRDGDYRATPMVIKDGKYAPLT